MSKKSITGFMADMQQVVHDEDRMTLEDCYEDKKPMIEELMSVAMSVLFDDIEADDEYSLSTDENIELCEDLFKMWCNGGKR